MASSKNTPKSICILRLSAIGDCCHAISLVQHIQKHWPQTKITWVIGKIEAQLIKSIPNLVNIELIVFDKKEGIEAFSNLRKHLKNRRFDVLLHLQANFRANLVSLCIPAKKRIGFGFSRARELQWLFTNIKAPISGEHVA
ncbi:MAG TPA: glycosyltransferase family 9 protein, partial [Chitinophagaceae bacterium]|nr:glycosyltransferase family 9 protein [Chitinophagaceae bacterium]